MRRDRYFSFVDGFVLKFVEAEGKGKKNRRTPKPNHASGRSVKSGEGRSGHPGRLQDRGLQEMKDEGACLSMHQPWASLLVHDIKKWVETHCINCV